MLRKCKKTKTFSSFFRISQAYQKVKSKSSTENIFRYVDLKNCFANVNMKTGLAYNFLKSQKIFRQKLDSVCHLCCVGLQKGQNPEIKSLN